MSSTLRDAILAAEDIRHEIVEVPEWGVSVEVRGLTAKARADLLQNAQDGRGGISLAKAYPMLVIACCYDPESGAPVFDPADREALENKSGAALERVALAAARLSGLDSEAEARFQEKVQKRA